MADPVIRVEQLGKKYRIGMSEKKSDTIAGAILNGLKSPFTNLKQIRNLSRLEVEDDSIFWALRDVSFEVHEGEVLGIIGHNGAGKSTLLKILSQITEPSTGEAKIRGRVAALLEVGTGFHSELTGRENIYMNGTILGMTKKEINRKMEEIVDFSGVEKYLDTPVKFYSSGMRVRLGFAVAAHLEPEILIIDEVLSVGDAEFQKKCLGKMEDVAHQGRTVLFVSHNMTAVQSLCQKGVLLKNGIVEFSGEIKETVHQYLTTYSNQSLSFDLVHKKYENDLVELLSVKVLNQDHIRTIDKIELEFKLKYKQNDSPIIDVTFHLNDEMNNVVFTGTSGFDLNIRANRNVLKIKCIIPANFLFEGTYRISKLMIVKDKGFVLYKLLDVLSFDVVNSIQSNLGWMGRMPGFVKPPLHWENSS